MASIDISISDEKRTDQRRGIQRADRGRVFTVAGLFAGIGGLELGLHSAGHRTMLMCEIDDGANAVIAARFPDVKRHRDIRSLKVLPREVDLICAGFPCQDLSQAGRTVGIGGEKSGLIEYVLALLARRSVPWIVLENVPFMLQLQRGRALSQIVKALEDLGYKWGYRVVDTQAFGLPQRRERVFLVASLEGDPRSVLFADDAVPALKTTNLQRYAHGFYWTEGIRGLGWAVDALPTLKNGSTVGIASPPAMLMPDGRVLKPDIRDAERMQGFPDDWTAPAGEVTRSSQRWSLVGNAVTVDVASWLGRRLRHPGKASELSTKPLTAGMPWPKAALFDGRERHAVAVSAWPVAIQGEGLLSFLRYPGLPLSARATSGFLSRARTGSLRFPQGFLEALDVHLKEMRMIEDRLARSVRRRKTSRASPSMVAEPAE
jgi:DNA (cytosine-5)-methyltransferase 1